MRNYKEFFIFFLLSFLLAFNVRAGSVFSGKVVHIADGDTITVLAPGNQQVKVRLYGVDCPEKNQAFGQKSRQFTTDRVAAQPVDVEIMDTDRYGRTVGIVRSKDGGILNRELLANGLAWHYGHFCKASFCGQWKKVELEARRMKKGLWRDKAPLEPWQWRRSNR